MPFGDALYLGGELKHLGGVRPVGAERQDDPAPFDGLGARLEPPGLLLRSQEVDGVVGLAPDDARASPVVSPLRLAGEGGVVHRPVLVVWRGHDRERPAHLGRRRDGRKQSTDRESGAHFL